MGKSSRATGKKVTFEEYKKIVQIVKDKCDICHTKITKDNLAYCDKDTTLCKSIMCLVLADEEGKLGRKTVTIKNGT